MGAVDSTHCRDKDCPQKLNKNTQLQCKLIFQKPRHSCKDNIKVDLTEIHVYSVIQ
jgi:hypothetical protein